MYEKKESEWSFVALHSALRVEAKTVQVFNADKALANSP